MAKKHDRTAIEQIEWMRNLLAFMLVGAFICGGGALFVFVIPESNKDVLTYMVGQLSGMALTVLSFYFIDKVGQAALDATRADNTGKMADLAHKALDTAPGMGTEEAKIAGAEEVEKAATDKTNEIKSGETKPGEM